MTSTVPSVEDFTNAFPNHLSPIVGEPTYQTLKELKDQLPMPLPFLQLLVAATMATSVSFYLLPPTQPSLQPPSPNPHTRANTLPSLLAPMPPPQVPSSDDTPKTHDNGESSKTSLPPSKINFLVPSTTSTYAHFEIVTSAT